MQISSTFCKLTMAINHYKRKSHNSSLWNEVKGVLLLLNLETGYQDGIHNTIKESNCLLSCILYLSSFVTYFIKSVGSLVLSRADGSGGTFCRPLQTADLLTNAAEQRTGIHIISTSITGTACSQASRFEPRQVYIFSFFIILAFTLR